ncbi:arylsulfotransferase family protein [Nocardioides sp. BP30]|uniref:arylsulfotransferase family protein n=1 Tax=Nocardioides sp. BP30 TaxID=3036374 RepID=UPI002468F5BF|nr:arylsulfotransferase family protein [Nocardioides sp. BP30]WGL52447.1 arylsulfotransferase family protein [Nocardioides sp. BP30]
MHHQRIGLLATTAATALTLTAALAATVPAADAATYGHRSHDVHHVLPSAADTSAAPPVTVTKNKLGSRAKGDIFVAPYGTSDTYASGAEILSPNGKKVLWYHRAAAGKTIADFRTQTYRGKKVLTFWQGTGLGGVATGTDYIYNDKYRQIAEVHAGNGLSADGHEFLITKKNTALILSYTTATADLTSIGGPANQTVIDGVVQEVDIRTGKVLFSWNSADHVPYSESQQPLPASASTPWDWFHVNAVKEQGRKHLLIDARNTWTAYDVNRRSGAIDWKLGGKNSSFTLKAADGTELNDAGRIFAWQHDAEAHGHGLITVFDNESAGTANTGQGAVSSLGHSRSTKIRLDLKHRTATLVKEYDEPTGTLASSQGNTQLLSNGHVFTGWGALPHLSEFNARGKDVFDASYPTGFVSYRAYRLPWKARR